MQVREAMAFIPSLITLRSSWAGEVNCCHSVLIYWCLLTWILLRKLLTERRVEFVNKLTIWPPVLVTNNSCLRIKSRRETDVINKQVLICPGPQVPTCNGLNWLFYIWIVFIIANYLPVGSACDTAKRTVTNPASFNMVVQLVSIWENYHLIGTWTIYSEAFSIEFAWYLNYDNND